MRVLLVFVIAALAACSGSGSAGKPCSADGDCDLGQVCDNGACGAGCRSPRDCPPDRPLCDGACVQCVSDADCTDAKTCISGVCRKTCVADEDCPGQHCDLAERVCVDCLESSDCELGNVCFEQACVAGCERDRDCPSALPACDPDAGDHGTCYECNGDAACGPGRRCVDHACREACTSNAQCPGGVCDLAEQVCVQCLDTEHCSLGNVCVAKACVAGCEEDRDCPAATPECAPADGPHGTCYQCTANADCGAGGMCVNHTCQGDTATMVDIPAGSFIMGSDSDTATDNRRHVVTLSAYSIDMHEVTYARYRKCVDTGPCLPPSVTADYNDPTKAQHPVAYVTFQKAETFCSWAGKRLPTEAEWERGARSADERTYPWGAAAPTCTLTNAGVGGTGLDPCVNATTAVGTHPTGVSPAGLHDMAGNVREWVSDWYAAYPPGNATDPQGPTTGTDKLARGGSFVVGASELTTFVRPVRTPTSSDEFIGFRCAKGGGPAPVPSFTVTPGSGPPSTTFAVDASASTDPVYATSQLSVRWDWTDDGVFDTAFSTTKTSSHVYPAAGSYTIRVEVRNPANTVRSTTRTVMVTGSGGQGSPCTASSQCLSGYVCLIGNTCAQDCVVSMTCSTAGTTCGPAFVVEGSITFACQ